MKDWIILKNRRMGKRHLLEHICMGSAGYHSPYICRKINNVWKCSDCGAIAPPEIADAAMLANCIGEFPSIPEDHTICRGAEDIYISK